MTPDEELLAKARNLHGRLMALRIHAQDPCRASGSYLERWDVERELLQLLPDLLALVERQQADLAQARQEVAVWKAKAIEEHAKYMKVRPVPGGRVKLPLDWDTYLELAASELGTEAAQP